MTPQQYCEAKARGAGSSFFYAFLFLPEEKRRAMMALYAFCREVDDIADEVRDPQVAMQKLGFWHEELERTFSGRPTHPVGRELDWVRTHYPIDRELLVELLDGMRMDIQRQPVLKRSDLSLYAYRVAGVVGLLSIEIFGYRDRAARRFATTLGEALQLTNILRDLAVDARRGRIYLAREDLVRHRLTDQDFIDGTMNDGMRLLLRDYGRQAFALYDQALEELPATDRESLRPSLVMAAIYHAYLRRLRNVDYDVWRHPVRLLPATKIWIAWRTWRREAKSCRQHPEQPPSLV